jgi:hypothetical protein
LLALGGVVVDRIESPKKIVSPRLSAPSVSQPAVRVPACRCIFPAACVRFRSDPDKVKLLISRSRKFA